MEENMDFYDYKVENGVVSAKGTYQEENKEPIPIVVVVEPNGAYYVFSEVPLSKEKEEWIVKGFQLTLDPTEV